MAVAANLDKSRPYAEVYGHSGGACFEQDNALFRADGTPLVVPAVKAKPAKARTVVVDELSEAVETVATVAAVAGIVEQLVDEPVFTGGGLFDGGGASDSFADGDE